MIKKHSLKAPQEHLALRKAVVNSMKSHPQVKQWVQSIFHGKRRAFNRFLKEQSQSGIFTDANGLAVIGTADYLGVNYHIVGTSNNERNPVSKYGRFIENRHIFHIGFYQDTTLFFFIRDYFIKKNKLRLSLSRKERIFWAKN